MGKYVDNRTSSRNRSKMKRKVSAVDLIAYDERPIQLSEKQIQRSQAQAKSDAAMQERMLAEREARLANLNA